MATPPAPSLGSSDLPDSLGSLDPPDSPDPSGETVARLRRDAPGDEDDLDAQLQLAELRRRFAGAEVAPVRFRHWEVERRLGKGGMGAVYLARDPDLDRRVALKILAPALGSDRSMMDQRLRREAQALARIRHPNVVQVHGVDLEDGRTVIEMEYVEGPTLRQWQAERRSWREVVAAYVHAGEGLVAVHEAGLVHRDVKPDNLLMTLDGEVKVVDLGLAVGPRPQPTATLAGHARPSLLDRALTRGSSIVGTPGYMAPEQFGREPPTNACDQFSLAASLYEALMGVLPFEAQDPVDYADTLRRGDLQVPKAPPRLPRWLLRALRRSLSFAPTDRHPSTRALVDVLRRGLARRRRWLLGSTGLCSLLALPAFVWVWREPPPDPCAPLVAEVTATRASDDAARERLAARVTALGLPHAACTQRVLDESMARYASQWADASLELCDAHARLGTDPPRAEALGRQAACLAYTRARLDDTLAATAELGDDALASGLTEALRALEQLPACDDPDTLARWPLDTPPALDEAIASAMRLELVGEHPAAEAKARQAVAASAGTHSFLHAHALYRLGHLLGQQERSTEAFATLEAARAESLVAGDERLFCEVVAYQAKLVAAVELDPDAARRELGLAEACEQLADARSPFVQSELLEARGLLARVAGDPAQAVRWHERALALRTESFGATSHEATKALHNLGNAHDEQGEHERAREDLSRALAQYEQAVGPWHPDVAKVRFDLADVQLELGALDEANASLERAASIQERVYGPQAPLLDGILVSLARVEIARPQPDLALARDRLARARALQRASVDLDPHHPDRAALLEVEGALVLVETKPDYDYARALAAFSPATTLRRRHDPHGPDVLPSVAKELEMLYGLRDFPVLAARVAVEGEPLLAYVESLDPDERGKHAWWIGDASLQASRYPQAARYLALALAAYQRLGNQAYVDELAADLARAERHLDPKTSPTQQRAPR